MKYHLLAALTLIPVLANSYGLSRFGLRRPMVVYTPGALFRESQALINREFGEYSPKYQITDTDEKFQLTVDVPGLKASNINITLENDGQVLAIAGERAESGETYSYSSKFYQSFTLDPAIETEKITANLKDGVLVVAAPKDLKRIEASVQNIPIHEKEHHVEETKEEEIKVEKK